MAGDLDVFLAGDNADLFGSQSEEGQTFGDLIPDALTVLSDAA